MNKRFYGNARYINKKLLVNPNFRIETLTEKSPAYKTPTGLILSKASRRESDRRRYWGNREEELAGSREYHRKHRAEILERKRRYDKRRRNDPEFRNKSKRDRQNYAEKNRKRLLEYARKYRYELKNGLRSKKVVGRQKFGSGPRPHLRKRIEIKPCAVCHRIIEPNGLAFSQYKSKKVCNLRCWYRWNKGKPRGTMIAATHEPVVKGE